MKKLGILSEIDTNFDFPAISEIIKLSGVSFDDRQSFIPNLSIGSGIKLIRDSRNKHDKNAIKVFTCYNNEDVQIGWIPKDLSALIAPEIDLGIQWGGEIFKITGAEEQTKGVLVKIFVIKDKYSLR